MTTSTMTPASTPNRRNSRGRALKAPLVVGFLLAPLLGGAIGASVTPIFIEGSANHTCSDFAGTHFDANATLEVKIDPPSNGWHNFTDLSVFISNFDGKRFDWLANASVTAVFVKAGSGGSNLYVYDPPVTSDTNLQSPGDTGNGISHISFCIVPGGGEELAEPDLLVTKTADNETVDAGDVVGFTILIESISLDPSLNVTLNDTLPDIGGTWSVDGPDAGACSIVGDELSCFWAEIEAGGTRTVHVFGTTTADDCGDLENLANVTADEDIDTSNNEDNATAHVRCADVGVVKTSNGTAPLGGEIAFTIVVTSFGPETATNVTLNDSLPNVSGGWTLGGPDAADCTLVVDELGCEFGDLAIGETRTVIVTGTTGTLDDCGDIVNTAVVGADLDVNASNNESSDTAHVTCADVGVQKSARDETVPLGSDVAFTIVVTSLGPDDAENVTLHDSLPNVSGGWSLSGLDAGDCTLVVDELDCAFGTIPAGETRTVVVTGATGTVDDCGAIVNTANVTADIDTNTSNNESTDTSSVICSDVSVLKTALNGTVDLGDPVEFNITVTSNGPDDAENVTLNDTLPAISGGWTLGGPDAGDCSLVGVELTCEFGTIPVGETRTVIVTGATGTVDDCGDVTNFATVSAPLDTNASNNVSSDTVHVTCADVGVEKTADGEAVPLGESVGFTIVVTSFGPDDAENVTLHDSLPNVSGGWTLGGPDAGDCTLVVDELDCVFGTIPAGETRTINVTGETGAVDDCGDIRNTATVAADIDTNASNNESSDSMHVTCADVGVVKEAAVATVPVGGVATFWINVTSFGPDTATNVTLTDTLPNGTWTLGGPDAADCSITAGVLTCEFGDLDSGETRSVSISTTTTSDMCGTILNTATVAADLDTDATNNEDSATIGVTCVCQLTQGFWKNHPDAWPVSSLVLGDETYTKAELLALLKRPPKGDASIILAHQLIAAKLNVANGATASIQPVIDDADAILAPFSGKLPYGVKANSATRAQMIALSEQLDAYNNGAGGCHD